VDRPAPGHDGFALRGSASEHPVVSWHWLYGSGEAGKGSFRRSVKPPALLSHLLSAGRDFCGERRGGLRREQAKPFPSF